MSNAAEIQQKVVQDHKSARDYTLITEHGEITFDMFKVDRGTRQRVLKSLPEALLAQMKDQSDEDSEADVDLDDFNNLDDLGDAAPDNFDPDAIMDENAVEEFYNLILDALKHKSLGRVEIRELFEAMDDSNFYATGYLVLAYSAEASGVKRFRTQ